MQFREQGKKIQCIRSTYDPASKRSHQKVVASFGRWSDSLPSAGLEELTEAERAELVEWFAAKQAKAQASRQQWKVGDAPRTLADLAESIRAADTLTADHAAKIWAGMGELAKALRKAGTRSRSASARPRQPCPVRLICWLKPQSLPPPFCPLHRLAYDGGIGGAVG